MFVEKLELFGFKSFATRTEVPLARGMTAIVGPNGCGKSNISDAFRWVLGEQSARALRGDRIQDVIFKGTRTAKPLGMAEVVLTVSNDDGVLPLEYTHVSIARRVFRSGDSEFSINKVPCRLKDIRDLFSGTGLGSHGYAVIERDMVDAVLSEKDEARRFLFEEAAGITKYKQRRKESERRLEGVEQDLTRIEDTIREIERGVRSLARQAGKVRRWRRLKEELDHHEVRSAWERWRSLREKSASSESLHARREHERAEAQAALSILETRRETLRLNLLELGARLEEAQRAGEGAARALASAREEIRVLATRAESWAGEEQDLQARLEKSRVRLERLAEDGAALAPRLAELRQALAAAEARASEAAGRRAAADQQLRETRTQLQRAQQLTLDLSSARSGHQRDLEVKRERREAAARRHAGLRAHLDAFAARETQVGADLAACETRLGELDRERREGNLLRDELAAEAGRLQDRMAEGQQRAAEVDRARAGLESRLAVLTEQKARHEGFDAAVRRLLEDRVSFPGLVGAVGEEVRLRPEGEAMGRAVLGEHVPWVLVRDEAAAVDILGRLRGLGLGGVTLFPLRETGLDPKAAGAAGLVDREVVALFDASAEALPFVGWLAAGTRLAASLEEARVIAASGARAVTPEGEVVDARRVYRLAGGESPAEEILHRAVELPRLAAELDAASARLESLGREIDETRARIETRQGEQLRVGERLAEIDRERANLAEQRTGLRTELAMLGEERIRLVQETEHLVAEVASLEEEIERLTLHARRSDADAGRAREDFDALARRAEEEDRIRDERTREAAERELEMVRLRSELAGEEQRRASLEREADDLRVSIEEMERRHAERSREAEEAARRSAELSRALGGLEEAAVAGEREHAEARARHQECQDAVFALDAEIRGARERLDEVVQVLHEEDVERLQTRGEAERLRERVLEDHGVDLETYEPKPDPAPRAVRRRRRVPRPSVEGSGAQAGAEAEVAAPGPAPDRVAAGVKAEGDGDHLRAGGDGDGRDRSGAEGDRLEVDATDAGSIDADELEAEDDGDDLDDELDDGLADLPGGESAEEAVSTDEERGRGAPPFAYTPETRAERMAELRRVMVAMGNLNFLAEEEYASARERLDFHRKQAADLRQAREDLLEAIRRINETAGRMFQETFTAVQEHFAGTFDRLFPGGESSLTLQGGDPLEGDIEIAARPRGKRLESIRLLSSGERALTAIALLFALYLAKPSPVCLLDEVDAPLDDANLERFLSLVRHFSSRTQFVCITHNKKTMEMADRLFGVTMEEPGISKIVSVQLDGGSADLLDGLGAGPSAAAGGGPGGIA